MADDLPSRPQFTLPEDLDSLAKMRDQLGDYLNTLERNTDTVNAWLAKHQNGIIVGLHQLNRGISRRNEQEALTALQKLGETAGFVIAIQDFPALAEGAFGRDSKLVAEIAKLQPGIPKAILED